MFFQRKPGENVQSQAPPEYFCYNGYPIEPLTAMLLNPASLYFVLQLALPVTLPPSPIALLKMETFEPGAIHLLLSALVAVLT